MKLYARIDDVVGCGEHAYLVLQPGSGGGWIPFRPSGEPYFLPLALPHLFDTLSLRVGKLYSLTLDLR